MHEMGLMDAMLRMVSRICKEEKLEHVNKITLEVGELSGIEIHYLTDCYAAVADGTPFE
ncbi:MAG: hydrogenase maturation nickel metallochaperone HypA, partial [Oscillospiraceae bacterium]|nr:hydrogenase maturation nickel metallochaperone HypA [Oscillospiraceae bacterium]